MLYSGVSLWKRPQVPLLLVPRHQGCKNSLQQNRRARGSPYPHPEAYRPCSLPRPQLNNSDSGLFTVFRGINNFSRIHLVDKWNGLSKVRAGGGGGAARTAACHTFPLKLGGRSRLRGGTHLGWRLSALGSGGQVGAAEPPSVFSTKCIPGTKVLSCGGFIFRSQLPCNIILYSFRVCSAARSRSRTLHSVSPDSSRPHLAPH